jgi:oxaloacetate decarboxylase alpha subunit
VPRLVDTSIRLLSQEPLAGRLPTAQLFRLAELLDGAGFAYLEVSGGGVFDCLVKKGVESPWERIRALNERTQTPLALALRGRFLVGSRPVDGEFVRSFVATAAENGIEIFRLHDPLNDVSNLREAAEAIAAAGREFDAGLVYSSGRTGETETLVEQARKLQELGAARVLLHDPTGSLLPARAGELVRALGDASGLPVGVYLQGSGGSALAAALEAARAGADLIACALYPVALTLHRVSGESLAQALGEAGVDVQALWRACDIVDEHIGDAPVTPLAPRIATRAAEYALPAGLVAALDTHLRAHAAGDRIDEVLDELARIRLEAGSPPLAAPIGQILASQALLHVLAASRWTTIVDELRDLVEGRYGATPAPLDASVERAVELLSDARDGGPPPIVLDELRESARGLAASDEDLLLLALFGPDAEPLLETMRARTRRDESVEGKVDQSRAERIREIVRIVQESGVGEVTIEDEDFRVTVRRTDEQEAAAAAAVAAGPLATFEPAAPPVPAPTRSDVVRVESPMVGTFYRAAQPGAPPFVEVGDVVGVGQTLCLIEAMKLFNELKSEVDGTIRAIHADNAQAVEFGQLLFEIEPVETLPLDAI